jgi:hypothetical protein
LNIVARTISDVTEPVLATIVGTANLRDGDTAIRTGRILIRGGTSVGSRRASFSGVGAASGIVTRSGNDAGIVGELRRNDGSAIRDDWRAALCTRHAIVEVACVGNTASTTNGSGRTSRSTLTDIIGANFGTTTGSVKWTNDVRVRTSACTTNTLANLASLMRAGVVRVGTPSTNNTSGILALVIVIENTINCSLGAESVGRITNGSVTVVLRRASNIVEATGFDTLHAIVSRIRRRSSRRNPASRVDTSQVDCARSRRRWSRGSRNDLVARARVVVTEVAVAPQSTLRTGPISVTLVRVTTSVGRTEATSVDISGSASARADIASRSTTWKTCRRRTGAGCTRRDATTGCRKFEWIGAIDRTGSERKASSACRFTEPTASATIIGKIAVTCSQSDGPE